MLMITDANCKDNKALGIAGVKGGTAAEIDASTTAILLESANFDPISVRMTAKKLGLRTDASQRFENGLTPELTMEALQMVCGLIVQIAGGEGGATIDAVVDDRNPAFAQTIISLKYSDVENLLGFAIPHKKIVQILHQLGCGVQEGQPHGASGDAQIIVTVPYERLDLTIKEDIIEEIGRVYGFFNVPPLQPKNSTGRIDEVHVPLQTIAADIIRAVLTERGFNEVYTYTFRNNGERELQNPIASDKKYLRTDLASGLSESLTLNMYNAPLLQIHDFVKIFEIGNVFKDDKETLSLALAIAPVKKIKNSDQLIADMFTDVRAVFEKMFNVSLVAPKATVWEIAIEDIVSSAAQLPHTFTYPIDNTIKYKKISPYPFMLRDIAVFVPEGIVSDAVFEIVKREVGELLVSSALFDVFTKKSEDGSAKTSYAYSLVFQSNERTLSDDEINVVMERVTKALNEQDGWQVR